jgi:SAM-dependent methyltransferase
VPRHADIGELYDRWVTSWTPWGWYTRWYLRHQSAINLPDLLGGIGSGPHARLLDVGCACGVYLAEAYERGHGREVLAGVDLSGEELEVARERLDRIAGAETSVRLEKASATDLPFDDASFDAVISNAMIKYLDAEALDRFLREAGRVLVPGGWLAMGEFGRDAGMLASSARYAMDCGPERFRTADQQAECLLRAGFSEARGFQMRRLRRIPFLMEGAAGRKPVQQALRAGDSARVAP